MGRMSRILAGLFFSPLAVVWCQLPPPRTVAQHLTEEVESPAGTVAAINGVRSVSGGVVFVNDRASRRVIMLDDHLRTVKVVLDATAATGALYGQFGTHLIAMGGDSTMFVDAASRSIVVFDAQGRVVRRSAVPSHADLEQLLLGNPAFDLRGRLVYRGRGRSQRELLRFADSRRTAQPDTAPILRVDLVAGQIDTLGFVRIFQPREQVFGMGDPWIHPVLNPAPTVDEWTLLPDGRVAIVRGADYRVEFVDSTRAVVRGASIPIVAQPLDRAGKLALLDSSRAMRARMLAAGLPIGREVAPLPDAVFFSAPGIRVISHIGSSVGRAGGDEPADSSVWASVDELPDRLPAFLPGGIHGDVDGNTWVQRLAFPPKDGGLAYDVIGPLGQIVDRVEVPAGSAVVGFASSGVVLLARPDASGLHLVRGRYTPRK